MNELLEPTRLFNFIVYVKLNAIGTSCWIWKALSLDHDNSYSCNYCHFVLLLNFYISLKGILKQPKWSSNFSANPVSNLCVWSTRRKRHKWFRTQPFRTHLQGCQGYKPYFWICRSFRPWILLNFGSKIRFWLKVQEKGGRDNVNIIAGTSFFSSCRGSFKGRWTQKRKSTEIYLYLSVNRWYIYLHE